MTDAWLNAFGAGLNLFVDVPTAVVGAGVDNSVGGNVVVGGNQHIDGSGHSGGSGGINIAVDAPVLVAGVGVDNHIGGNVNAIGLQQFGGPDSHPLGLTHGDAFGPDDHGAAFGAAGHHIG